jgi:DNA-binding response OmpR family regulator
MDDESIRGLLAEVLTGEGYQVVGIATDGLPLARLDDAPLALALIDVWGPSGQTLARRLRHGRLRLPLVGITTLPGAVPADLALDALMDAPFDLDRLLDVVSGLTTRNSSSPSFASAEVKAIAQHASRRAADVQQRSRRLRSRSTKAVKRMERALERLTGQES